MPRKGTSPEQMQVVIIKPPFDQIAVREVPKVGDLRKIQQRSWVVSWSEEAGEGSVRPVDSVPVNAEDFLQMSWGEAQEQIDPDDSYVPSWETADHTRASRHRVNVEKIYEDRGATGKKVPKTTGFALKTTPDIQKVRDEDGLVAKSFRRST